MTHVSYSKVNHNKIQIYLFQRQIAKITNKTKQYTQCFQSSWEKKFLENYNYWLVLLQMRHLSISIIIGNTAIRVVLGQVMKKAHNTFQTSVPEIKTQFQVKYQNSLCTRMVQEQRSAQIFEKKKTYRQRVTSTWLISKSLFFNEWPSA